MNRRLFAFECKKLFPLSVRVTIAVAALLLFGMPFLVRESALGVYETAQERRALYDAHSGDVTADYLRSAARAYAQIPMGEDGLPDYLRMEEEQMQTLAWIEDLIRQMERIGHGEVYDWIYHGAESVWTEPVPYADVDGWIVYFEVLGGGGMIAALGIPAFVLSFLLNGEVSSGMRRVILTIAGQERKQMYSKWTAAALTAAGSAVVCGLCPLVGTALSTGLGALELSVQYLGVSLPFACSIGRYLFLRWLLLFAGSIVTAGLTAGFSGCLSQSVGAMVSVLAIFLLPLLPLPREAPAWVVEAQTYGPAGFFSGEILLTGGGTKLIVFCLGWLAVAMIAAAIGRRAFRGMKIPEDYFRA